MAKKPYDVQENLFQAVDTIVQARIANLPYDKTIECEIIDTSNAFQGRYKVTYQATTFECTSLVSNLKKGDLVYVSVPQSDFRQDKIILAKKQKSEVRDVKVLPFLSFVKGHNLFSTAQNEAEYSIPVNGSSGQRFTLLNFYGQDTAAGFTKLGIKAAINTGMQGTVVSGEYGIKIRIAGYDQTKEYASERTLKNSSRVDNASNNPSERFCKEFTFSSKADMVSTNLYNTHGYINQEKVIDITGWVIDNITVTLWQDGNFKNEHGALLSNQRISFTNLQLYLGYDIEEFNNKDSKLVIYSYDGLQYKYTNNQNDDPEELQKTIKSRLITKDDKNNFVINENPSATTWEYMWEKYNPEGTVASQISNELGFEQINTGLSGIVNSLIISSQTLNNSTTGYNKYLFVYRDPARKESYTFISNILTFTSTSYQGEGEGTSNQDDETTSTVLTGNFYILGDQILFKTEDGKLILHLSKNTSWFSGIAAEAANYTQDGNIYKSLRKIQEALDDISPDTYTIIDDE